MADEREQGAGKQDLAERVQRAFQAVREKDLGPVSGLQALGLAVVPLLPPYLEDASEDVRREAVSLLAVSDGEGALPLLVRALADTSPDIRERAALALYERYEPAQLAAHAGACKALAALAAGDNPSAAALLLLGYCPGPETERVLRTVAAQTPAPPVRLFPWSAPVVASLPARVALARLGDREAQLALAQAVAGDTPAELEFLLAALREIEAPTVLRALTGVLADTRKAATVAHSGAVPQHRLCDVAVNAFVRRFSLKIGFELSEVLPYSVDQLDDVRRRVDAAIPR